MWPCIDIKAYTEESEERERHRHNGPKSFGLKIKKKRKKKKKMENRGEKKERNQRTLLGSVMGNDERCYMVVSKSDS